MRGRAPIYGFGRQDNELPDRCFAAYVSLAVTPLSIEPLSSQGLDQRSGSPAEPMCRKMAASPPSRRCFQMIGRAVVADVPFSWVAADAVYGVGNSNGPYASLQRLCSRG